MNRRKKLERLGAEKLEDGSRFKLSYHMAPGLVKRPQVQLESQEREAFFDWPQPADLRYQGPVLQLRDVYFRYPGATSDTLAGVTLDITTRSRIGLLGPNGCGKSTLMGLIAGALSPRTGSVERYGALKVGFFTQHHVDSLTTPTTSSSSSSIGGSSAADGGGQSSAAEPPAAGPSPYSSAAAPAARGKGCSISSRIGAAVSASATPLSHLTCLLPSGSREQDVRDYLGAFGVQGSAATQPLGSLSGGQKARVVLAGLLAQRPHVLLLDEPTNHLDLSTVQALGAVVNAYGGGVVLISHDIRFFKEVVPDESTYVVKGGKLEACPGGVAAYAAAVPRRQQLQAQGRVAAGVHDP